jgi:hypothetical protein
MSSFVDVTVAFACGWTAELSWKSLACFLPSDAQTSGYKQDKPNRKEVPPKLSTLLEKPPKVASANGDRRGRTVQQVTGTCRGAALLAKLKVDGQQTKGRTRDRLKLRPGGAGRHGQFFTSTLVVLPVLSLFAWGSNHSSRKQNRESGEPAASGTAQHLFQPHFPKAMRALNEALPERPSDYV